LNSFWENADGFCWLQGEPGSVTCAAVNGDHAIGIASASNHFADMRDVMELGHCNFQFYDNAAGHYSARRRYWLPASGIRILRIAARQSRYLKARYLKAK
jgi:hypothetical protein